MASVLARRKLVVAPNPLAYPAGVKPGFDRSHPAAGAIKFSGVASGSGFLDLKKGLKGVAGGTPTAAVYGGPGPASVFGTGNYYNFANNETASVPSLTIAAIIQWDGTNAFNVIFSNNTASSGVSFGIGVSNDLIVNMFGVGGFDSFVDPPANVPCFVAVSLNGSVQNYLVKRLDTGAVQTASGSSGTPNGSLDGIYSVAGYSAGGNNFHGGISAVMYSAQYLSMPQLLQFASDPWSFWYPNKTINLASSAASGGGSFLAAWAQWILPVLGTGNY